MAPVKWSAQMLQYVTDLWHQVYKRVSLGNRTDPNVGAVGCEGDPGKPYLPIRILKEARAEPHKKFPLHKNGNNFPQTNPDVLNEGSSS